MLSGKVTVYMPNLADIPQIFTDWNRMIEVASDTAAKLNKPCK